MTGEGMPVVPSFVYPESGSVLLKGDSMYQIWVKDLHWDTGMVITGWMTSTGAVPDQKDAGQFSSQQVKNNVELFITNDLCDSMKIVKVNPE